MGLDRYAFVWGDAAKASKPFNNEPLKPGEKKIQAKLVEQKQKKEEAYTRAEAWSQYTDGIDYNPRLHRPPGGAELPPGEVPVGGASALVTFISVLFCLAP
jgi:hypothetical protein